MTVRLAGPADETMLYQLLTEGLYLDNPVGPTFSPTKVRDRIEVGTRGKGGIIGVVDGDDEIAASVGLFLDEPWYSNETTLSEYWLYVRPTYRSSGLAIQLFNFAKDCRQRLADGSGLPLRLVTSVVSERRLPAKMRLWRKHARLVGGIYIVGDDPVSAPARIAE